MLKEDILRKCKENDDLYIDNDKEYYFCVGATLRGLKKCSKEFIKIENSLMNCNSVENFDTIFKNYAKKCIITGIENYFKEGSQERKIFAACYTYKPSKLDLDSFLQGFMVIM